MKNVYERVRKAQAKAQKTRAAIDYKAGESVRRSAAARISALERRDIRDEQIINCEVEPRNKREFDLLNRVICEDV
jgi:hypothetical protein